MKKHYVSDPLITWLVFAYLMIGGIMFLSFSWKISLVFLAILLPLLIIPFIMRKYIIVKDRKIYRYTEGAKNKDPDRVIIIEDIAKIKLEKANDKLKSLRIYAGSDDLNVLVLRGQKLELILEEVRASNRNIQII